MSSAATPRRSIPRVDASKVDVVASGLRFPEGPIITAAGSLVVTEIAGGQLTTVAADGTCSPFVTTGGGPNGAAVGPDGSVYVCNNGGRWPTDVPSTAGCGRPPSASGTLQRATADGSAIEVALAELDGVPLSSPNDCVVDAAGGVWFTDPVWMATSSQERAGAVCYLHPDGSAVRAHVGLQFPNGIGLTDDGRFLVVCESMTGLLLSFRIDAPGVLAAPKVNGHIGRRSVPDGFCLDEAGRVIVAGHQTNCLFVLDAADGRPVEVVELPDAGPTNCCFGGDDGRTLFVTSSDAGRVLALPWPVPGMVLHARR